MLKQIEIPNFKHSVIQTITLSDKVNLLTGYNSSGKSVVMKDIYLNELIQNNRCIYIKGNGRYESNLNLNIPTGSKFSSPIENITNNILCLPDDKRLSVDDGLNFKPGGLALDRMVILVALTTILKPDDILLIEYPELYLHGGSQSRLVEYLLELVKKGITLVLESHSDHILNGLRIGVNNKIIKGEDLNVLYFDHKNIIRVCVDDNGRIDSWPLGFFDQWDKDLDSLFDFIK